MAKESSGLITADDLHMTLVPKNLFFEGMNLPVDIFIRMRLDTYLYIGRAEEKAQFSSLHGFSHPNFSIYVRTEEHEKLISHLSSVTSKLLAHEQIPIKVKTRFISGLVEDAVSSLHEKKFMTASHLRRVAGMVLEMQAQSSVFGEILKVLQEGPPSASSQAMVTCLTSLAIAEEMDITQGIVLEKLAMGSLLHDIGLNFVPEEILSKPRHLWTNAELQTYETHPIKGAEMLQDLKDLPIDVMLIVAEHHENAQGTGFPKKIRDIRISPLSRIVSLSSLFAEQILKTQMTSDEAISYIENVLGQPYNRQVFISLKNIVNKTVLSEKIKNAA